MSKEYVTVKDSLDDLNKLLIEMNCVANTWKCASDKWKEEIKSPLYRETFWDKMKIKCKVWRIFR